MTNLTGNPNSDPAATRLTGVPDLIYPHIRWADSDYSNLELRLDFHTDCIVAYKFRTGEVTEQHYVDPAEVVAALVGLNLNSGLLSNDCLFWGKKNGYDRLGIYLPPRVWPVVVRDEDLAWRVPLPGLIFVGHDYDYSLWAVTERPTDTQTPLYMAPCPNVHPEGVCRGNVPFPRASATAIWQAVDAFFSSKFNRDLSNQKSRTYPGCILDQWRTLHQAGIETYPPDDLIQTNHTLGRLIHA